MHEIYELKEMLCEELEKYGAKGDVSAGELGTIDKLAHTVKNLGKIIEMYEEEEGEYSGAMGGMSYQRGGGNRGGSQGGSSNRGGSYRGGSYARGRGRNARRDSRGRYSSERGYSRADETEDMIDTIRDMMGELPQEVRRDAEKFVNKLEQTMM